MRREKKGREKKAQFTVFVILAAVILVVFVLAIYLVSTITNITLQSAARDAVRDYLESEAINYYVKTCMDVATKEAVQEFAIQGGKYYDYQNGTYVAAVEGLTHVEYNTTLGKNYLLVNVSYGLLGYTTCPLVQPNPPQYPLADTDLNQLFPVYEDHNTNTCIFDLTLSKSGFFGLNNFTRLCHVTSPNAGGSGVLTIPVQSPCYNSLTLFPNQSAEVMISKRILDKINECIDFEVFEELEEHNITVSGPPSAEIVYNSESFDVKIAYPLNVKLRNREPVMVTHTFEYASDLRLTRMHNYVLNLLAQDSKNITFNLSTDYTTVRGFDPLYMTVQYRGFEECTQPECFPYLYDHLIIVEDARSKIGNQSLKYIVAVKNRNPALDYIHETETGNLFDILGVENESIIINPLGIDPDDEAVNYAYTGWLETYNETWDEINCPLGQGSQYTIDQLFNCVTTDTTIQPRNWTNSKLFKDTNRSANVTPKRGDIGPHTVTVKTIDESGLIDYQDVLILVLDKPKVVFNIPPVYQDTPSGNLSREDPFILDSTGSAASTLGGGSIMGIEWKAEWLNQVSGFLDAQFVVTRPPTEPIQEVPLLDYSIQNITPMNLSHPKYPFESKTHIITLTIQSVLGGLAGGIPISASQSQTVDVYECLPHRNPSDPSYPYNTGTNPFYADHTCCLGDPADPATYALAPSTQTCYTEDFAGEYSKVMERISALERSDLLANVVYADGSGYQASIIPQGITGVTATTKNDVFKVDFVRKCDGKRGNICAGDLVPQISIQEACLDNDPAEQCQGVIFPGLFENPTQAYCANMPSGETFESMYSQPGATGVCNTQYACSTATKYNDPSGKQRCRATCDGNGGCTLPTDCYCTVQACNAVCGIDKTAEWSGQVCKADCSNSCEWNIGANNQKNIPCNYPSTSCMADFGAGYIRQYYCYYDVACNPQGPDWKEGDYCRRGGTYVKNGQTYCVYHPNPNLNSQCLAGGACNLNEAARPLGNNWVCDGVNGWVQSSTP